jgi:mono/diheme cytochrome c family protein
MLKNIGRLVIVMVVGSSALSAGATGDKLSVGKKIFESNCASCHLKTGKGSPMMAKIFKVDVKAMDLASAKVASMKKQEVIGIITKGKAGKMPTFKGRLKKLDIAQVAGYIRSLGAADPKKKQTKPVDSSGSKSE